MKLAVIGGGSVRSPEFVRGAVTLAEEMELNELWLMDNDSDRLKAIGPLCSEIVRQAHSSLRICFTDNLKEALKDSSVIVTTMRVGQEKARVLDERIALRYGVLGQETTGAGGFSMAMRSIPAALEVAMLAESVTCAAWILNFTNPAGLVTQALHNAGYRRVVGICDSANTAQHAIAHYLHAAPDTVRTEVFGLNHLSWTRSARIAGQDRLAELLADDEFIQSTHLRLFGSKLIHRIGMFPNEYLYYYYFRDLALEHIQHEEITRGEAIRMHSEELFRALKNHSPEEGLRILENYHAQRSATYMTYAATESTVSGQKRPQETERLREETAAPEGYAGVALRTALALLQDRPLRIGLNVPNESAIHGLRPHDIVEVTCEVDGSGIHPIPIGDIPEDAYLLMRSVKRYENLAAEAILKRDRRLAYDALVAHPLIGSYHKSQQLVDAYLQAHEEHVGAWR